ncbi:hypothetical protein ACFLQZ_04445, partial [Acidobacteriota bacterium]
MELLEKILKKIPFIKTLARRLLWKYITSKSSPSYWINKIAKNSDLHIVQIGSNDGMTNDPIFQLVKKNNKWKVLFVEPVPYLFEQLVNNYSSESRFKF